MGIHYITGIFVYIMDCLCDLLFCRISCRKISQVCFHLTCNRVTSLCLQLSHKIRIFSCIFS